MSRTPRKDYSCQPQNKLEIDDNTQANSLRGEFLMWHYRLGYMSYSKMNFFSILRIHPSNLLKGKDNKGKLQHVDGPGKYVSIDKLESRNKSGYIGVLRRFITK